MYRQELPKKIDSNKNDNFKVLCFKVFFYTKMVNNYGIKSFRNVYTNLNLFVLKINGNRKGHLSDKQGPRREKLGLVHFSLLLRMYTDPSLVGRRIKSK